ncbi:hypothetical protein ACE6H2_015570 [Prunus campanulata]
MGDVVLFHECFEWLVTEVAASITNDSPWSTKPCENIILQELQHHLMIIGFGGYGFHPFRHIINSNKYVSITKGRWEWSHEINTPHIEELHNDSKVTSTSQFVAMPKYAFLLFFWNTSSDELIQAMLE